MDVPFLLSKAQKRRIEPFFPLPHGVPRVDDRRVVSAIIYVIKYGPMWRDAPKDYAPHKHVQSLSKGRSIIASSAGAGWGCSTGYSPNSQARLECPTGS